jgi:uncharacterized protein YutD
MFSALHKKMQKLENEINEACDYENAYLVVLKILYTALNTLEDLKGFINEVEDTILEEDSHIDRTNL